MEARTTNRTCLAIVLAAGEGTRMASARPKVLHAVAGQSLLGHVLDAVAESGVTATAVVVGPGQDEVAAEAQRVSAGCRNASSSASGAEPRMPCSRRSRRSNKRPDDILIVYGDTPLIRPATLARLRAPLAAGAALAVLGFRPADPTGYGRLIMQGDELVAIREEADAERGRTRDRSVQWRHHGACRQQRACHPGADRRPQSQARILSDRCGRDRARHEASRRRGRSRGGRRARHQHQEPARRSGSGGAAAPAPGRARCRRHAGRAGDGVPLRRHQIRPRRRGRALCGVRREGHGRRRRRHPLVLASRRRACRQGRFGRAVRAAAAGHAARRGRRASAISSRSRRR